MMTKIDQDLISGFKSFVADRDVNLESIVQKEFWAAVEKHKLFPAFYHQFGHRIENVELKKELDTMYSKHIKKISAFQHAATDIFQALSKKKVDVVLIKGIALSKTIYNDYGMRAMNDLDLLVPESGMLEVDRVLRGLGYEQFNDFNPDLILETAALKTVNCHEFFPYRKQQDDVQIYVEVAKSLHERVRGQSIEQMVNEKSKVMVTQQAYFYTLNPENMFIQLIENTYENFDGTYNISVGGTVIRDYLDLYLLLKNYLMTFEDIKEVIERYELSSESLTILSNLFQLFPNDLWLGELIAHLQNSLPVTMFDYRPSFFWNRLFDSYLGKKQWLINFKQDLYSCCNPAMHQIKMPPNQIDSVIYDSIRDTAYQTTFTFRTTGTKLIIHASLCAQLKQVMTQSIVQIVIYNNNIESDICCIVINLFSDSSGNYASVIPRYFVPDTTEFTKDGTLYQKKRLIDFEENKEGISCETMLNLELYEFLAGDFSILCCNTILLYKKEDWLFEEIHVGQADCYKMIITERS